MIGIYKITNKHNGWNYIGSSKSIENRWKQHIRELEENNHHCYRLQYDWNKYGVIGFDFCVLEICGEDELISKEQCHIDENYNEGKVYNTKLQLMKGKNKHKENNKEIKYNCCENKILFPSVNVIQFENLTVQRIFFMIISKIILENTKYVEISVSEYMKYLGINSNTYYDRFKKIVSELENVKIDNEKVFESCELEKNVLVVVIKDFIFNNINNKNNIKLNLTVEDILKFKTPKTLSLLLAMNNHKSIEISLEKAKEITGVQNKYNLYSEFKRCIIKPIEKDLSSIGYKLEIDELRKERYVYILKIKISKLP